MATKLNTIISKYTAFLNPLHVMKRKVYYYTPNQALASFNKRLLASVVDWLLCCVITQPISAIVLHFFGVDVFAMTGIEQFSSSYNRTDGPEPLTALLNYYQTTGVVDAVLVGCLLSIIVIIGYFAASWRYFGTTIGFWIFNIKIIDDSQTSDFAYDASNSDNENIGKASSVDGKGKKRIHSNNNDKEIDAAPSAEFCALPASKRMSTGAVYKRTFAFLLYTLLFLLCTLLFFVLSNSPIYLLAIGVCWSAVFMFVNPVIFLLSKKKQMIHDIISSTVVVSTNRVFYTDNNSKLNTSRNNSGDSSQ